MAEAPVEKHLQVSVRKHGGLCLKLIIMGKRNFPDRTCLMPGGKIFFVECKDTHTDARKSQSWFHRLLERLGFKIYVAKTKDQVDEILNKEMAST
jgi:hypothetical protein